MKPIDSIKQLAAVKTFLATVTLPANLPAADDTSIWPNYITVMQNGIRVAVPITWDGTTITLAE